MKRIKKVNEKKPKKLNKQGQITVFIIMGLVLLLGVGVFIYFNQMFFAFPGVSQEIKPVATYIEQCVNDVTVQATLLAGMQGGYVTLPDELAFNPEAYVDIGVKVPLWYYQGESKVPTQKEVEDQLVTYLKENVKNCINNFDALKPQFAFGNLPDADVKVKITDTKVLVTYHLPVNVQSGNSEQVLPELTIPVATDFGKKLRLAMMIIYTEEKDNFLELLTNEIIASSDYLPYDGMEFTCQPRIWHDWDINEHLKRILTHNLPKIYFTTTNQQTPKDPYYKNIYAIEIGKELFKEIKVTTMLPPQRIAAEVHPKKNGKVTSLKLVADTFSLPCVKVYHHKYDTTYNVLFEVSSENGEPFYFATPVIVKRNEPNRKNEVEPWPTEVLAQESKVFCEQETETTEYTTGKEGTLVGKPTTSANWQHELQVNAIDALSQQSVSDATVSYLCGRAVCEVGTTAYSGLGIPFLRSAFPTCLNGQVVVEKEGYLKAKELQTVDTSTSGSIVNVQLIRLLPYTYSLSVVEDHNGIIAERELEEGEYATITLTNEEHDYEKTIVYPPSILVTATDEGVSSGGNEGNPGDGSGYFEQENKEASNPFLKLELIGADTTYNVDITIIKNEQYRGGYHGNWTQGLNSVLNSNHVAFVGLVKDTALPPVLPEEFKEIMDYAEQNSNKYKPQLATR